ncbi:MAG: FTR1 family protein [Oscillochloridaceae bacterium]|nr:FTR1 family protein [Chloroflexaceae bacterium]MDW8389650.1 FTR1 family protein [Oscillochloridaceae bacterium]
MRKVLAALTALFFLILAGTPGASSQGLAPGAAAEAIRTALLQAQFVMLSEPASATALLEEAFATYSTILAEPLGHVATTAPERIEEGFVEARQALAGRNAPAFAAARARIWTALLAGGYDAVMTALGAEDAGAAQLWLPLREFRHATRFSRPAADATRALRDMAAGSVSAADAVLVVRADLLDTYQARLTEALNAVKTADVQGFASRRAEAASLAEGYFAILAPAYAEQRGDEAMARATVAFADLRSAAVRGEPVAESLAAVEMTLSGFRAAPLSPAERIRRTGQILRFLGLVPVEYARGVRGGQVTIDLEIREAITFHAGAAAAFADLRAVLERRDPAATARVARQFAELGDILAAAGSRAAVAEPATVRERTDTLLAELRKLLPSEWQQPDSGADFDVIRTTLDQMAQAARLGDYARAESARLEAYAMMEIGPEVKLIAFAPHLKPVIEGYFWYGQDEQKGLAYLIARNAPYAEIAATRAALDRALADAEQALAGKNAPFAIATNASVIVFREGLEAVLILAALMGSLKIGAQRRFRRPLWIGAGLALLATVLTWLLARGALLAMARLGERLEAIVSLIAIAVLLLITNWFFHDVYWKGWMQSFHQQKRRILGGVTGQWAGLIALGFTSIYREGFETVLFLQALVLEGGSRIVLSGVSVGLILTLCVGFAVFGLQMRLPHKKMLIVTGILIGAVLLQMVGHTVHVMQTVGWMSIHPIRWLVLPYWTGFWFGLYATWEGILFQAAAAIFVIGSYVLAEYLHRRRQRMPASGSTLREA